MEIILTLLLATLQQAILCYSADSITLGGQLTLSSDTFESIDAVAVDESGPIYYLLVKPIGQNSFDLFRMQSGGKIDWYQPSTGLSCGGTGSNFVNPLNGRPIARPRLAFDATTKTVIASGWSASGPPATLGYRISAGIRAASNPPVDIQLVNYFWSDACWSPELKVFVAVGMAVFMAQGGILISPDGSQWTVVKSDRPFGRLRAIAWSSQMRSFAAVGFDNDGPVVYTSSNGRDWTLQSLANYQRGYEFRYVEWSDLNGGCFVAVGGNPSENGHFAWAVSCGSSTSNWVFNVTSIPNIYYANGVAASTELNVTLAAVQALGENSGMLLVSVDGGFSWQIHQPIIVQGVVFRSVAWSPSLRRFVAVGLHKDSNPLLRIAVSDAGSYQSWTLCNPNDPAGASNFIGVRWVNDLAMFIVVVTDQSGVAYLVSSPDGLEWTKHFGLFGTDFDTKFAFYSAATSAMVVVGYTHSTYLGQIYVTPVYFETRSLLKSYHGQSGALRWSFNYTGAELGASALIPASLIIIHEHAFAVVTGSMLRNDLGFAAFALKIDINSGNLLLNQSFFGGNASAGDSTLVTAAAADNTRNLLIAVGHSSQPVLPANGYKYTKLIRLMALLQLSSLNVIETVVQQNLSSSFSGITDLLLNQSNGNALLLVEANGSQFLSTVSYLSSPALTDDTLTSLSQKTDYWFLAADLLRYPNSQFAISTTNNNSVIKLISGDDGAIISSSEIKAVQGFLRDTVVYLSTVGNELVLALAGRFNSVPGLLLINYKLSSGVMTNTTDWQSSTPLPTPNLSFWSEEVIKYFITGGVSFFVLLAAGLISRHIYRVKLAELQVQSIAATNQQSSVSDRPAIIVSPVPGIDSTRSVRGNEIELASMVSNDQNSFIKTKIVSSVVTVEPHLLLENIFASDAAQDPPVAAENYIIPQVEVSAAGVTSTLVSSNNQGLYVPGNYLLSASTVTFRPVKLIYANKNCEVHRAQVLDPDLRKRCRTDAIAVKIIKKLNAYFVEAFFQEISIMYFFKGKPNFIQLVGFCNVPYQIMTDYYELGNLEEALLRRESVIPSKKLALTFSMQIGGALTSMHQNGFAHSDIKALNVFLDLDEHGQPACYLGDFGLAQVLDDSHLVVKAYRVFNVKGLTIPYAAPEVLDRYRSLDPALAGASWRSEDFKRADVYSFTVLLYEIVTCLYAWDWNLRSR